MKRHGGSVLEELQEPIKTLKRPIPSGNEIRSMRMELGMNQTEFGHSLGMTGKTCGNTVSKWERGLHKPNPSALYILRQRIRAIREKREQEGIYARTRRDLQA